MGVVEVLVERGGEMKGERPAAILVTGGAGGIGTAVGRALAARGDLPVLADIDGERADRLASEIDGASGLQFDVSDPAACERAVAAVIERHGRIDGVVCCAGIFGYESTLDMTQASLDRVLRVNLHGTFFACQAAARAMIAAGHGGSMVLFSSGAAQRVIGSPAYSISKGAIDTLTRELAVAWAPHGIRVNAIAPGPIDTEMSRAARETPEILEALMAHIPAKRLGRPEEVAAAVAFLLDGAASYLTATIVPTDGGFLAV
jgi:glucose 1-dehydrogenase